MKLLLSMLLGANLMITPILNESSSEIETNEQIPNEDETNENTEEKGALEELIAKWLNGEIELDEETMKEIQVYLEPEIDKMLQDYIVDNEERQMVTSVIMGVISGLGMILVMFLYTRKIIKANTTANDNNAKFSVTSKQIKDSSEIIKNEVATLKEDLIGLKSLVSSDMKESEKVQAIVKETLEILESKLNGVAGILKIAYEPEVVENEKEETSTK